MEKGQVRCGWSQEIVAAENPIGKKHWKTVRGCSMEEFQIGARQTVTIHRTWEWYAQVSVHAGIYCTV